MPERSSVNDRGVLPLLLVLYVAQSLPMAFFSTLLPIVLRGEAYSLTQIALLQLIKLPWILKFAWAPWVDRRTPSRASLRRMIIASEGVYALLLIALSALSLEAHLVSVLICMLLSFVASSVQDIAVDKFAIRALTPQTRSLGNAMQSGGNFIGSLLGAGGVVALYHYVGWQASLLLLATLVLLALIPLVYSSRAGGLTRGQTEIHLPSAPERPSSSTPPRSALKTLSTFYRHLPHRRYLLGLMLYFAPIMPLMVLAKPLLVDWGLDLRTAALTLGLWGSGVAALASFAGGALMRRLSLVSSLRLIYLSASAVGLLLVCVARTAGSLPLALLAIGALWGVYAFSSVCLYTMSMGRVRGGSEGTDFTLQTITAQLGGMIFSAGVGALADALGYSAAFALMAALALLLSVLAPRLLSASAEG